VAALEEIGNRHRFHCFKDSVLDLSVFDEESVVGQRDRIPIQISPSVVTAISLSNSIKCCQIVTEMENLSNLCHPLTARPIEFVLLVELRGGSELKTARMRAGRASRLSRGYSFESARVVDTGCDCEGEGEGDGDCTDCAPASTCARPRAAAGGGEGG
jgi:hypothetical protein